MNHSIIRLFMCVLLTGMVSLSQAAVEDYGYSALQEEIQQSEQQQDDAVDEGLNSQEVMAVVAEYMQQHEAENKKEIMELRVNNEFWYIVLLCVVAIIALLMVLYFLRDHKNCPRDIVNAAGLILIIFGTIILVLVVDTTEQLTAAIGVLGAIAGYLFGTIQSERRAGQNNPDP